MRTHARAVHAAAALPVPASLALKSPTRQSDENCSGCLTVAPRWQLHHQECRLRLLSPPCRYFLAKHPAALKKLEEELDAAGLLKTPQNPSPRQFTYADIGKLRYLDWCIKVSTPGTILNRITPALGTMNASTDLCLSAMANQCC